MSGLKLYEVNQLLIDAMDQVSAMAEQEEGVIRDDWVSFLDEIEIEHESKCLNIARLIKSLNAESDAISAEAKKLSQRSSAFTRRALRRLAGSAAQDLRGQRDWGAGGTDVYRRGALYAG